MPTLDEAIAFILTFLRDRKEMTPGRPTPAGSVYGYDVYAPTLARQWVIAQGNGGLNLDRAAQEISGNFFEAAWELCRRGLLRPGVRLMSTQAVTDGGGYSLTSYGASWLQEAEDSQFIALQPGALAAVFAGFRDRFGDGYHQRTQEALRCRGAEAWLATCAMAGAAAESILLALATAKAGNEDSVLRSYMGRDGRKAVLNTVSAQAPRDIAQGLQSGMTLLSYWRDCNSHGQAVAVTAPEAEQAMRELLSLSQFAADHWEEIVGAEEPSQPMPKTNAA